MGEQQPDEISKTYHEEDNARVAEIKTSERRKAFNRFVKQETKKSVNINLEIIKYGSFFLKRDVLQFFTTI